MTKAYQFPYLRWERAADPQFPINSAAISDDGGRVVAATFQGNYGIEPPPPPVNNEYSVYCWDREGKQLWLDQWMGYEGAFAVAISGNGSIAAAGGWMEDHEGFVRAYDAQKGNQLFTYDIGSRVNGLALSQDGSVLAVAANDAYLFQQTDGVFPATPATLNTGAENIVETIDMPADGSAFVMGDHEGNVYYVENNAGAIGDVYTWAGSTDIGPVHSVAISADGSWFAAVGDSQSVYLFNEDSIKQSTYATTLNLGTSDRMRWVAISDDGSFLSVVENDGTSGLVYGLQNNNGTLTQLWNAPAKTKQNPNCTSTDAAAKYVAVATGYAPNGLGGEFCLFDGATGERLWHFMAPEMAWPCFISADGSGIIAGSDYGVVYYFTPQGRA
jgi:WD40 repeat protein